MIFFMRRSSHGRVPKRDTVLCEWAIDFQALGSLRPGTVRRGVYSNCKTLKSRDKRRSARRSSILHTSSDVGETI